MSETTARELLIEAFKLRYKNMRFLKPEEEVDAMLGIIDIGQFSIVPKSLLSDRDTLRKALEEICKPVPLKSPIGPLHVAGMSDGLEYCRAIARAALTQGEGKS